MPALPQLYPYKAGQIEPVVMPGEYVGIWVNKVWKYFKVKYIDTLPQGDPLIVNIGALAAAGTSAVTQMNLLEMPDLEFGQFRMEVIDDISVMLYQGRADQRHKTFQAVTTINRRTIITDPCGHTTEFFVYGRDNDAFLQAFNQTGYPLAQARVSFWGNRYILDNVESIFSPDKNVWTRIPATAHL